MNHSEQRLGEARRQHNEAILARHLHQLFQCLPMRSAFWLRPDLKVAWVIFAWNAQEERSKPFMVGTSFERPSGAIT
jgi:hypothetical protein